MTIHRLFTTALCRWSVALKHALSCLLLVAMLPAHALSPTVVVSQVYGGGGNGGATYTNDFIELFNRGTTVVNLTGWSVQYAAAGASSWQVTNLNGSIPPGGYYLIQQFSGGGGTTPLPTPDATGVVNINAINGKIALLNTTTALATTGCPFSANVIDFFGYGSANCFEGTAAAALSNTLAALRAGNGCTETDVNSTNFAAGAPNPRNSASPANLCGAPPTLSINDVTLAEGNAGTTAFVFTVSLSFPAPAGGVTFDIATQDNSATAPSDYTAVSLTAQTIPAGTSTYTFTVQVNGDGAFEANESFFVNVTNVTGATIADGQGLGTITNDDLPPNQPPVLTVPATVNVVQNVATPVAGISVADPDAAAGAISVTLAAPTGTLSATTGGGVTVTTAAGSVTLTGTLTAVNAFIAATGVTYTTATGATGTVTLTVTANDNGNTGSGGAQTDVETVTLNIVIPPVITSANATTFTVTSAGTFTVTATGTPAPVLSLTGTLPAGVTFTPATGVLAGTPALGTVGTYPLVFTAANGVNPNATQNFTLTVAKANQTITFANPGTQTFGTPLTLSATASSGLAVSFASTTPAVCTVSGTTVTFVGSGTCTINATQAGDANYNAAPAVPQSFTVNAIVPGAPTIGAATAGNGQATVAFTPPASNGGSPITGYTVTCTAGASTFTATGTASPITVPGLTNGTTYTCAVVASNAVGDSAASVTVNVTPTLPPVAPAITSANATIFTVNSAGTFTVTATGTPAPTLSLTGALPNGVTFTPATGILAGTPALGTVGTYPVTITAANGTLPNATQSFTLTVAKANQTITFANPGTQTFGTPLTLGATASSGQAVSYASTTPAVCTVAGTTATFVGSGTCTINATQAGDVNYNAASVVPQSFIVNAIVPGVPTIGAATPGNGQAAIAFTPPSSNGGSPITSYTVTCTAGASTFTASGSTSPIIVPSLTNGTTYTCSVVATNAVGNSAASATVNVTPTLPPVAPAITSANATTFTVNSIGTFTVTATGTPAPVLSVAGALPTGVTFTPATGVLAGTPALGTVGTYPLVFTAANGTLPNATQSFTLTVAKANQTITFTAPGNQAFGTPPVALTATASSSLPVIFTSATPAICSVTGSNVTFLAVGTCTINADQAGDANYNAAPQVVQSFTITAGVPGAPTITTVTPGNAQLTVAFTPPANTGGSAITSYTVTCTAGALSVTATGAASPIVVTGLTNGTAYSCSVTAANSAGSGTASAAGNGTPAAPAVAAPTAVPTLSEWAMLLLALLLGAAAWSASRNTRPR